MHSLGCGFFCRLYWRLALCRGFRKLFWSRRGAWRGRRLTLNPFWSRLSVEFLCIALPQNFSIMSEYMTPMGRIKHSNETGLRPVNQRSEGHKKEYWNGNDAEARVLSDDNDSCHLSMGRNTKSPLHTIPISAQLFHLPGLPIPGH
jgi:ribosomal protein S18